jgi:hypothetical protein
MRRVLPLAIPVALVAAALAVAQPAAAATPPVRPASNDRPVLTANGHHPAPSPHRGTASTPAAGPARLDPSATAQRSMANGTVRVDVAGAAATVVQQVRAAGGRVLVTAGGHSTAIVPKAALDRLATSPGVARVSATTHPYTTDVSAATDAGPSGMASGAQAWQDAGITGAGVKVAIIDEGFGTNQAEFSAQQTNLGPNTIVTNEDCTDNHGVATAFDGSSHGLAVAELLQQQAPGAQLYLFCIGSEPGVAAAEQAAETAGVRIISSSLAWFGQGRGDGTGLSGSVPQTAARARQHGILWINSAGNYVPQHWSGTLADANHDQFLDIGNDDENAYPYESDFFTVAPGSNAAPTSMDVVFSWDQWPTTTTKAVLEADGAQCTAAFGSGGDDDCQAFAISTSVTSTHASGDSPLLELSTPENTSGFGQIWEVSVQLPSTFSAGVRYDLFGLGDTDGASDLACPTADSSGDCVWAAAAKQGSVTSPADSPYVLAAGAADEGSDGTMPGVLEPFSSQGPTIDGRSKPELTGWDGAPSAVPEFADGFYGTSAAAPTIAGAAALVASANPSLDAAQLQDFLQRRAQAGTPHTPPSNATGYGLLTLGAPTGVSAPAGARYTAVTPTRLLDTRTTTGGHHAPLGAGGIATVAVPGLPADATAVAINLTGTGATATTFMSAFPGGTAFPGTSNLNLGKIDPTAAVFAIVTVRNGTIAIRNNAGSVNAVVDELGYFGTGSETGSYTALPQARRVLDTRTTTGGHHGKLVPGHNITVQPAVPADASAAVVNITTTGATGSGFVSAAPSCSGSVSTLNLSGYDRANLAVVGLNGGAFCLLAGGHSTNVIVDVVGYLGESGSEYVALPAAQRIVDTRTGNGGYGNGLAKRAIGANTAATFYGANVGTVPAAATALFTGVTEADATTNGFVTVFPGSTVPSPLTSNQNYSKGRTVPNAVIAAVSGNRFGIYNAAGNTDAVVDLFGYFLPAG